MTITIPRKITEFQPTSAQKRTLTKARKNREKGEALTLSEFKYKLGLKN